MKTVTINVTQEHINRGKPGSYRGCPISLALNEHCPLAEFSVSCLYFVAKPITEEWPAGDELEGLECLSEIAIKLPGVATHFVDRFDSGMSPRPFTCQLQVPDWAVAEEPVRSPIAASSPAQSHDRTQGGHTPDDTHSSRAPSIASSVPLLS